MSIATPPSTTRPTVPSRTQEQRQRPARRGGPDWLPVIGWFVDDGARHSRINVIPLGNTTNPNERFVTLLKFYRGSEEPIYTHVSEAFSGNQNFRYESTQLLEALGESSFEGLVEITARSLDNPPGPFPWVDSWLEFYTHDGSFSGSVPGFVFKGGTTKRVMSGKWQHWPGVVANDNFHTSLLLLNYHARPVHARLDLFAPDGQLRQSAPIEIPTRLPRTIVLEDAIPDARRLLAAGGGFGSLRVWSEFKLPGFVLLRNRHTGQVSSFDHTVPFAGDPID